MGWYSDCISLSVDSQHRELMEMFFYVDQKSNSVFKNDDWLVEFVLPSKENYYIISFLSPIVNAEPNDPEGDVILFQPSHPARSNQSNDSARLVGLV